MRRSLADWERGEQFATPYFREQVTQFSPNSRAILEIQSARDLEVLTKIYANSVLLGDQGPDGWGIKYAREFDMTNDSKLFPPRPVWEQWGYRPDEYSRWIKGPWKPIEQLWAELGVDPDEPVPIDPACTERIEAGLASGEVAPTDRRVRCAQPPYDKLPGPRADLPPGLILSREATHYLREDEIPVVTFTDSNGKPLKIKVENEDGKKEEIEVAGPAIALPLYEGRMIGQFDFSEKGWVSGKGRGAVWRDVGWDSKSVDPQFLVGDASYQLVSPVPFGLKLTHMRVGSATNRRSAIGTAVYDVPTGDTAAIFWTYPSAFVLRLLAIFDSFVFDFITRARLVGLHLDYHVFAQNPLPKHLRGENPYLERLCAGLSMPAQRFAPHWPEGDARDVWCQLWALTERRRVEMRCTIEAITGAFFGLQTNEIGGMLTATDLPRDLMTAKSFRRTLDPKGFWRIDEDKHPEHRRTVLSLVAFRDLQEKIAACGGNVAAGIEAFCNQNNGAGWMLPETLRLADYGLGHDDRAKQPQPVRECFGPRFYDWQLAQTPEESWKECHLHARNLLGEAGYQRLLAEIEGREVPEQPGQPSAPGSGSTAPPPGMLFDPAEQTPLFARGRRGGTARD